MQQARASKIELKKDKTNFLILLGDYIMLEKLKSITYSKDISTL